MFKDLYLCHWTHIKVMCDLGGIKWQLICVLKLTVSVTLTKTKIENETTMRTRTETKAQTGTETETETNLFEILQNLFKPFETVFTLTSKCNKWRSFPNIFPKKTFKKIVKVVDQDWK